MKNMYYQYHECAGYRAKVTIEWEIPDNSNKDYLNLAENIADEILSFAAPKTKDMVNKMRRV